MRDITLMETDSMLQTRVIVTGSTDRGSSRTEECGAKFRDQADIERVKAELIAKLNPFYPNIRVTTREVS